MKIYFAPIQGHTDFIYRNIHSRFFTGISNYYTPFIRTPLRNKDKKDINPQNNLDTNIIPQILGGNKQEMKDTIDYVSDLGYKRINVNFGCPFKMITNKGKGCGAFKNIDTMKALIDFLDSIKDLNISLKLRLGYDNASQILDLIPTINESNICSICIHPRIGTQEYKGFCDMDMFNKIYEICKKPLIYNGEINNIEDISDIITKFPELQGIMIGRGLLKDPALAEKYFLSTSSDNNTKDFKDIYKNFHSELLEQYSSYLEGGEAQILNKIKTLWDYFLPQTDKKTLKRIKKCRNLRDYKSIISSFL